MEMKYEVEQEVLNAVLRYLAARPYEEVFQLVGALQQSKPIEQVEQEGV